MVARRHFRKGVTKFMGKDRIQESQIGFYDLAPKAGSIVLPPKHPSHPRWREQPLTVIWQADPASWRFTYVSPQAVPLLGFPLERWLENNFWVNQLHPSDREETVIKCRKQKGGKELTDYDLQYRMRAADGRVVWIYDYVHVVAGSAGVSQLQGFMVDITSRIIADQEYALLAALVESSNDAIFAGTLDGTITSWNAGAERLYGYKAAEVLGRSDLLFYPLDRIPEAIQILRSIERLEPVQSIETVRLAKGGRPVQVCLTVSPIQDWNGTLIGFSSIARDVSEKKRLETEILRISEREQTRIAQDLHDGLGQELASVACLAAFLNQELNKKHLPEAETSRKLLDLLGQAIFHVRTIARGLHPVEAKPHGLQEALTQLARRTEEIFQVKCRFVSDAALVFNDSTRATHLYRIAQEATHNSIQHGKATSILLELNSTGKELILFIQDNGGGIPSQLPDQRQAGLGLRTMRHRAHLAAGTLEIRSEPGKTTIICAIPLTVAPVPPG
jgi:PAS domain S-box-containing protein